VKTIADALEELARACGHLDPELEARLAEMRAQEKARALPSPQVVPTGYAAQARAHDERVDHAIPGGSHDPPRIAPSRRRRATPAEESPRRKRFLSELTRRGARACRPRDVPPRVQAITTEIMCDPTGRAGERYICETPNGYAVRSLVCAIEGGRPLTHVQARATLALAWFFWTMGRSTRRRGFARVSDDIPIGTVRAVIRNPVTGQPYSRSGLCATSWGKRRRGRHQCGALTRLRRHGLIFRVQPPAGVVPLALVGPSGYAFAQTWISVEAAYVQPEAQGPP
jgi:hypothetical protein